MASSSTLSLGQAAQALGVSPTTARRWADEGRMGTTRTAGGHRRFPISEVRRMRSQHGRSPVSPIDPPRRPLPALADLAGRHGDQLCDLAWRGLYGPQSSGFYREAEGRDAARHWMRALATAALTADYGTLADATAVLARTAERAGSSLLERHLALERLGEMTVRALQGRSCPNDELTDTRRLFAHLVQGHLAAAD